MSDLTDYAAAFKELRRFAEPDSPPTLTEGDGSTPNPAMELDAILLNHKLASTWAAATPYTFGQIVQPTVRNGRRYRVTQAGTSGATEPTWPTSEGGAVTDGASSPVLTFEEVGSEYANIYDIRSAKEEVCQVKMSKSAHHVPMAGVDFSVIHRQWSERRKAFRGVGVA